MLCTVHPVKKTYNPPLISIMLYLLSLFSRIRFPMLSYITVLDGIHGQKVVAVAKLEMDDLQSGFHFGYLSGLSWPTFHHHVLQQQAVFADPLHRPQQVRPQVHFIAQFHLLLLEHEEQNQTDYLTSNFKPLSHSLHRGDSLKSHLEERFSMTNEKSI